MISENYSTVFDTMFTLLKLVLVALSITVVISIGFVITIYFYNKSRNVKEKPAIYSLVFLFGILGAAGYFFSTRKKEENMQYTGNKKKYKIISVILAVICTVATVINVTGTSSSLIYDDVYDDDYLDTINELSTGFYDRYGISYQNREDLVYYTVDGYEFKLSQDSRGNSIISQSSSFYDGTYKEEYELAFAYIDKNGYIVFTDKQLELDNNADGAFCYIDSNNEHYAYVLSVFWDADGNLCE